MENISLIKTLLKENAESDAQKIWREYLKQNIYKSANDLTQTDASAFHDRYSPDSYPQYYNGSGENTSLNQEGLKIAYQFTLSEKANAIKHQYYPRANDNGTSYYKQYPYIKLIAQKYKNDDIAYGSPKEKEFIKAFNRFMNLYMDKHFDIIDNKTPDKLSINEFIDVYNDKYDEQNPVNSNANFGLQKGNYKVELVDTDEKARKYGKYTKWCITAGSFNNYASDISPFYVFLREGYENEEMIKGHNYPLDSYGLSMFAILIDEDGEWKQGTTRWNHGTNNEIKGGDFVVTKNIVEQLVGQPFRNVCPPILTQEELEQRIKKSKIEKKGNLKFYIYKNKYYQSDDNGNLLKDKHWDYVKYDEVYNFNDGFATCKINNKGWNWLNEKGEIFLPNQWFDIVGSFNEGFAECKIKDKGWNWINEKGEIFLPNQWFDFVGSFNEGVAKCKIDFKWNWVNEKGEIISPNQWFDDVGFFKDGVTTCKINNKGWNWVNEKGEIISPNQWFNNVYDFKGGFAACKINNNEYNWVNEKGEIISPNQWFDNVYDFNGGFAICEINNKGYNWVNEKGEIISPNQWFDEVGSFNEGFAKCKITNKGYNWVNEKGEIILPNQWFNEVGNFNNGFAKCKIGYKWYYIDTNGNIINKELSEQITKMKKMIKY